MKKVIFKNMKIEGFGIIGGYKVFPLNSETPQLNIVRGLNGAGKTTPFSALTWALYGKPLKPGSSIETWEHVRPANWSGTMVSVSMYIDGIKTKITRCKDYAKVIGKTKGGNRLIVERDGEEIAIKDKRDIQKVVEEILGMSFSLFTNSVLFQQKGVRLLELPGPEKKRVLEESFKLTWLTVAMDLAKADKAKLEIELSKAEVVQDTKASHIKKLTQLRGEMVQMEKEFYLKRDNDILKFENKLLSFKENLDTLRTLTESIRTMSADRALVEKGIEETFSEAFLITKEAECLDLIGSKNTSETQTYLFIVNHFRALEAKLGKEVAKMVSDIRVNQSAREKIEKEIAESLFPADDAECRYCGYKLTEESKVHLMNHLEAELKGLPDMSGKKKALENTLTTIKFLEETREALTSKINTLETLIRKVQYFDKLIYKARSETIALESLKGQEKQIKEEIEKLKEATHPQNYKKIDEQIAEYLEELQEAKAIVAGLNTRISLCNWAIKDPLSNSGIKSYLFKTLLDRLNRRLEYYSNLSGFSINLMVDEDSGRKNIEAIISRDGYPVDVRDLSGGETQLVNVVIALASGEVLLSDVDTNVRIFDEVSEHLDSVNTELLANFLKNLSMKYNVFVITHNNQFIVTGANEIKMER